MAEDEGRLIESEHFFYQLHERANGVLHLEVITNQSAFYFTVERDLTPEEAARYRKSGKKCLEAIANRVVSEFWAEQREQRRRQQQP